MAEYVERAVFVYSEESERYLNEVLNNPFGVQIEPIPFGSLNQHQGTFEAADHVVVSGNLEVVKTIFSLAMRHGFSVGMVPSPSQRTLARVYDLPIKVDQVLEIALRTGPPAMDVITCNGEVMLFKANVGSLPVLDSSLDISRPRFLWEAVKGLFRFKLLHFGFVVDDERRIEAAACGCMIIQRHENTLASRLIANDSSINDGMISLIVSSPFSIIEYIKFILCVLKGITDHRKIPTVGYVKSPKIRIETKEELPVFVDGTARSRTPLDCATIPQAVRFNVGEGLRGEESRSVQEKIEIKDLPEGKMLYKAGKLKKVPFFPAAPEERYQTSLPLSGRMLGLTPSTWC
jgi:diacylglycerol kinase family enzyme